MRTNRLLFEILQGVSQKNAHLSRHIFAAAWVTASSSFHRSVQKLLIIINIKRKKIFKILHLNILSPVTSNWLALKTWSSILATISRHNHMHRNTVCNKHDTIEWTEVLLNVPIMRTNAHHHQANWKEFFEGFPKGFQACGLCDHIISCLNHWSAAILIRSWLAAVQIVTVRHCLPI